MEEPENNLEKKIIDGDLKSRKINKNILYIIIVTISIIVIGGIILLLYFLLKKDNSKEENKNKCEEGEEEKCYKCENNVCILCNPKYTLINGNCQSNFSLKAIYESVSDDEKVQLIYNFIILKRFLKK